MQATLLQTGAILDYTPGGAVEAGDVVEIGTRVLVAPSAIPASTLGALAATGVFEVVKDTSTFAAGGDAVYWDNNGNPVGGTAGTGAATTTAAGNYFMGYTPPDETAATGDGTVMVFLRSYNDSTLESLALTDLSDVGATAYTAGAVLVGSGTAYAEKVVSGDATLAATGALTLAAKAVTTAKMADLAQGSILVGGASDRPTALDAKTTTQILVGDGTDLKSVAVSGDATMTNAGVVAVNAAHTEQVILVPIEALGAGADLSALTMAAHPRANTLVSLGYLSGGDGDFGTIDDSNTAVFLVTDGTNTIVTKTYNTGTQPVANTLNDLGTLDVTHKVLTAGEIIKLAITNGTSAKTPAGYLVIRTIPTNA